MSSSYEDLGIKFVKPTNGQEEDSFELEFNTSGNTFSQQMLGGTINLNKAFVTKIITPEPPSEQGPGTDPLAETDSDILIARFGINNFDQAKIERSGDPSLWDLWNIFKGTKMDTSIDALSNISVSTKDGEQIQNIYQQLSAKT